MDFSCLVQTHGSLKIALPSSQAKGLGVKWGGDIKRSASLNKVLSVVVPVRDINQALAG